MSEKLTSEQIDSLSFKELKDMFLLLQSQFDRLNDNYENLIEQIRIANQDKYGSKSEKLEVLDGQLSFFNEVDYFSEDSVEEPSIEEVLPDEGKKTKRKKKKGQRDADLKDLPHEKMPVHTVSTEALNEAFGEGNWKRMPDETYVRLRFTPASWTVEEHTVEVYVGTGGDHQDEFLRGDRPDELLRNSILTPSLAAAIGNAKYVNSIPLYRIEQEFQRNGVFISRQNMANWMIKCANWYLNPICELLRKQLLQMHVNQCDETPVRVMEKEHESRSKCYMWVHRSGEFYTDRPIVLYEYQETRHHIHPLEFYRDFNGVLVTDSLQQYHILERELPGLTSANCWAHARRDYSDALKAIGSKNQEAIKKSVAYQALVRIAAIYKLEGEYKNLSAEERLLKRKTNVAPLVDAYFAWVKSLLADGKVLPKGKTGEGLKYSINQEKYLRVFLTDGEVPLDNSASERSLKTFCVGKKNWILIKSIKGAHASAVLYSITETAKLNNLNPYYYLEYLFTEMPKYTKWDKDKKIQIFNPDIKLESLEYLLPWSTSLPEICYKPRR